MSRKKVKKKQPIFKSYRKRLEAEMIAKYSHYKLINGIIATLIVTSALLLTWEIQIYRSTIINVYIPLAVWILTGIITTPFLYKILNIYILNPYNPGRLPMWAHLFVNILVAGSITVTTLMSINYYFPKPPIYNLTLPIESTGNLAKGRHGCDNPYVHVIYKEQEKEIVFPCGTDVKSYHYVSLQMEEGFFGFEIILDKSLSTTQ